MTVLLDLEWIEKDGIHLTQLSALRVNDNWDIMSNLDIIANPGNSCLNDPNHIALGGLSPVIFGSGVTEQDAILTLNEWLLPDDEVWVWAKSNLRLLGDLWVQWLSDSRFPYVYSMAEPTRKKALRRNYEAASPFTMLARMNENPPFPEHKASNDVEAMRKLFMRMNMKRTASSGVASLPTQRESNQRTIDKTDYNYLYLRNSAVFHTRSCKACLNAKSTGHILGSVYYETAANNRRPCKLCNPVPPPGYVSKQEKNNSQQLKTQQAAEPKGQIGELIKVKMLTGEVVQIKRKNIIGWCRHTIHKGAVNKSILKKHDCLGKNCPYLERNDQSPFWANLEQQAAQKEKQKELKKANKAKEATQTQRLQDLTRIWQSGLDDLESDMFIVRIEQETAHRYKVFYVSDNSFADGNRFPDFLALAKISHPRHSINLRHIRDIDGHFVTRDEYFHRFGINRSRPYS